MVRIRRSKAFWLLAGSLWISASIELSKLDASTYLINLEPLDLSERADGYQDDRSIGLKPRREAIARVDNTPKLH
jgi:hypothetical protein